MELEFYGLCSALSDAICHLTYFIFSMPDPCDLITRLYYDQKNWTEFLYQLLHGNKLPRGLLFQLEPVGFGSARAINSESHADDKMDKKRKPRAGGGEQTVFKPEQYLKKLVAYIDSRYPEL